MSQVFIDPIIAQVRRLYATAVENHPPTLNIADLLSQHAEAIHAAFKDGDKTVIFHLACWYPPLIGKSHEQIMMAKLSQGNVRECVAREYGFPDWASVNQLTIQTLDSEFESAVEHCIHGELDKLVSQLDNHPELTTQRSNYGHASTLLHYLGANGVESHRQITPMNAADIAHCLLEHGADVNAHANMYGGGSTALGLVQSSAHPAKAGVVDKIAAVLVDAGAKG